MTTSIIITIIILIVFVWFYIHIRTKILKVNGDKFFLIKYFQDIKYIINQIKNSSDAKRKKEHILNLIVHLFLLLFLVSLIILLISNPDPV
jgi:hypothetical protein